MLPPKPKSFDPLFGVECWLAVGHLPAGEKKERASEYVRWQNRATNFYCAARILRIEEIVAPAAFCAFQAIENILKATISFYKGAEEAEKFKHRLKAMQRFINNQIVPKAPHSRPIDIPDFFVNENRFQSMSRYPKRGRGTTIELFELRELDRVFYQNVLLVPHTFKTELVLYLMPRHPTQSDLRKRSAIKMQNEFYEPLCEHLRSSRDIPLQVGFGTGYARDTLNRQRVPGELGAGFP